MTHPDREKAVEAEHARREEALSAEEACDKTEDLHRRITELSEALKARDEFISAVAHELRNPMTPIVMQIQRLMNIARSAMNGEPEQILRGLERLEQLIERYIKRATTLLDVSRMTSGVLRLELESVDLSKLVRDVAAGLKAVSHYAGSRLDVTVQDDVVGMFDRLGVEQIIDNLLSNAIKYGAGNPIEIALSSDGTSVRLTVSDHGIGISEENQARIFGRFERVIGARQHGGFGIGLWIVGQLVNAMGGEISVSSRIGEGSTFTVRLPLAEDQETE